MENNDLGSKKMNNKQEATPITDPNASAPSLQPEIETDTEGVKTVVQRARHMEQELTDDTIASSENSSKPSTAPEAAGKKMVENKDKNSDITSNRYPNAHPDNHKNRGNIDLDGEKA